MTTDVHIRKVGDRDRDAVEALWLALHREQEKLDPRFEIADDALERWRNDFSGWVRGNGRWLWVAEKQDRIAGYVAAERNYLPPVYRAVGELFVTEIFVIPDMRRQGIGRALVDSAIQTAREERVERMRLIALSENDASIAFWQSIGAVSFSETLLMDVGEGRNAAPRRRLGF